MRMIRGRKPIQHFEVGVECKQALAELRTAIAASVAGNKVDVSLRIDSGSLAKLPDARRFTFRRSVEHPGLLKRLGVITDQEAVIGLFVAVRRVGYIYLSAGEKQAGPLTLHQRTGAGRCDRHRAHRAICSSD